jgi:predicted MFS family arabinose efflux permease
VPAESRQTYLILFALWLMMFAASSQVIIIAPILPRIGEALVVPEALLGTLVTVYAVMLSVFALMMGPVSDRIGRRRMLLYGCAAMSVALLLHAFAFSFGALLVLRAVTGAAAGMLSGAAVSYVGDYFPYERRGWANGWIMSGIAFGQIAGIPLGTILADLGDFRWPFLMFGVTMAGATLLIARFVPQPDVRLSTGVLSLRRVVRDYVAMLRRPILLVACLTYFSMFLGIGLYVIYMPTWLEQEVGFLPAQIAVLFLVGGLANVITGPIAGRLSDRVGRKPLVVTSSVALAVLMVATTFVVQSIVVGYVLFGLAMITIGMRISPLQSLLSALVPDHRRGTLMSMAVATGQVGIGIGSAVAGITYLGFGYAGNTFLGGAALLGMAALVYFGLPEPTADAVEAD